MNFVAFGFLPYAPFSFFIGYFITTVVTVIISICFSAKRDQSAVGKGFFISLVISYLGTAVASAAYVSGTASSIPYEHRTPWNFAILALTFPLLFWAAILVGCVSAYLLSVVIYSPFCLARLLALEIQRSESIVISTTSRISAGQVSIRHVLATTGYFAVFWALCGWLTRLLTNEAFWGARLGWDVVLNLF